MELWKDLITSMALACDLESSEGKPVIANNDSRTGQNGGQSYEAS